eukprot:scaffold7909_cov42-Attheya_sp.AAC.4
MSTHPDYDREKSDGSDHVNQIKDNVLSESTDADESCFSSPIEKFMNTRNLSSRSTCEMSKMKKWLTFHDDMDGSSFEDENTVHSAQEGPIRTRKSACLSTENRVRKKTKERARKEKQKLQQIENTQQRVKKSRANIEDALRRAKAARKILRTIIDDHKAVEKGRIDNTLSSSNVESHEMRAPQQSNTALSPGRESRNQAIITFFEEISEENEHQNSFGRSLNKTSLSTVDENTAFSPVSFATFAACPQNKNCETEMLLRDCAKKVLPFQSLSNNFTFDTACNNIQVED